MKHIHSLKCDCIRNRASIWVSKSLQTFNETVVKQNALIPLTKKMATVRKMIDDKDMIEVNLNSKSMQLQDEINNFQLLHPPSQCITKSYSNNDLKIHNLDENNINMHQKYATIGGINKCSNKIFDNPAISCLRQMYCPDCHERLDADSVRFENLLACCLPFFPFKHVYSCSLQRSITRKVICNKCGSNLGYWKRT